MQKKHIFRHKLSESRIVNGYTVQFLHSTHDRSLKKLTQLNSL